MDQNIIQADAEPLPPGGHALQDTGMPRQVGGRRRPGIGFREPVVPGLVVGATAADQQRTLQVEFQVVECAGIGLGESRPGKIAGEFGQVAFDLRPLFRRKTAADRRTVRCIPAIERFVGLRPGTGAAWFVVPVYWFALVAVNPPQQ